MLEEIKKEARELAEKQSWVRKSLSDLIARMDEEVKDITGDFVVRGKLYEYIDEYHPDYREACFLTFNGKDDAVFYIEKGIDLSQRWKYTPVSIERGAIPTLRRCVAGIPGALDEILARLKELNAKYQEAVDKLAEMLAKLA